MVEPRQRDVSSSVSGKGRECKGSEPTYECPSLACEQGREGKRWWVSGLQQDVSPSQFEYFVSCGKVEGRDGAMYEVCSRMCHHLFREGKGTEGKGREGKRTKGAG